MMDVARIAEDGKSFLDAKIERKSWDLHRLVFANRGHPLDPADLQSRCLCLIRHIHTRSSSQRPLCVSPHFRVTKQHFKPQMVVPNFVAQGLRNVAAMTFLTFVTLIAVYCDIRRRMKAHYFSRPAHGKMWWIVPAAFSLIGFVFEFEDFVSGVKRSTHQQPLESLCAAHGYVLEKHTVATSDGFLLSLFRMVPSATNGNRAATGKGKNKGKGKGPVLLLHGLFQTSMPFLFNQREDSLAFVLADNGCVHSLVFVCAVIFVSLMCACVALCLRRHDVWLGNNRYVAKFLRTESHAPTALSLCRALTVDLSLSLL